MKTLLKLAAACLLAVPLLAAGAEVRDNGDGTVTLVADNGATFTINGQVNPDGTVSAAVPGGTPVVLPVALAAQVAEALVAGGPTAISEAIADVITENQAAVASNPQLVASIAALAALASPASADAVAAGALEGATAGGVIASNPEVATQVVGSVTGAGGTVSDTTLSLAATLSGGGGGGGGQQAGGGGEGGAPDAGQQTSDTENPATAESDTEPGEEPSPTT